MTTVSDGIEAIIRRGRSFRGDLWRAWRTQDCHVRRSGGERRLDEGERGGGIVDGVSPGRPQRFWYQRRPVDHCSPERGGMAQNGRTRGGTFHGELDRCRESRGCTTAFSSMRERDGKDEGDDFPKGSVLVLVRSL